MSIRLNHREKFITKFLAYFPFLVNLLDYSKKIVFFSPHDKDYWVLHQIFSKNQNITILDIGANIGQSSVGFRKLFPCASIHAIEANPDLAKSLMKLKRDGTIDDLTIAFVGPSVGQKIMFYAPRLRGYLFSTFASFDINSLKANLRSIYSNRIYQRFTFQKYQSDLITLDSLALSSIDFVKIDVEGYELSVLEGATALINKCAPVIFLEINSERLFKSIWHFSSSYRYRMFVVKNRQLEEISFDQFPLQKSRNFLLINLKFNPIAQHHLVS
jgi:FkbM family methyltransferase